MSPRRVVFAVCWAAITMFVFVARCGVPAKDYEYSNYLFGAPCTVKFQFTHEARAREIIGVIDLELTRLDSLLNYFSDASLVSELNRTSRVRAPSDVIFLVALSDSVSRLTGGLFDITIAPVLEAWGFYSGAMKVPTDAELARAKRSVDFRRVRITGDSIAIEPGMRVDLGGIAQGYAADRAADILRQNHVRSAIIDVGGEIVTIGRAPDNRPWRVGIKNPRGPGIIENVELQDSAVSTSGDYEKFFVVDGIRYPHIIDPRTGMPARDFASVTVFARDGAFCDALSTAAAAMGARRAVEFLDSIGIKCIIYHEQNRGLERLSNR